MFFWPKVHVQNQYKMHSIENFHVKIEMKLLQTLNVKSIVVSLKGKSAYPKLLSKVNDTGHGTTSRYLEFISEIKFMVFVLPVEQSAAPSRRGTLKMSRNVDFEPFSKHATATQLEWISSIICIILFEWMFVIILQTFGINSTQNNF